ncbi:uncharacterized protein LOC111877033 [Lactuca sativa]|uniref:uncharacterized protein LOC111877033 n=1 Tax=Lactuca sativa TaxID=4236 RepID=UPI000CD80C22|nr:uncharacterized protein LOC111877033 [Lactuca sativa]
MRNFQQAWFKKFWWLEYSEKKDVAFCFPYFLFNKKPIRRVGSDTFTVTGFNRWKKVNCGKDCAFIVHEGKTPASAHNFSVRCYEDLKNQLCHIENVIEKQTTQQVMDNILRLKVSIEAIKWLTFQACALRGHDERPDSINQGNFLELIKLLASYNKTIDDVVLENAPQNAKYASPDIQKEILRVLATNVQKAIRDEIGMAQFCLIVDESQDESKKEQMAIVVRFVDREGHVKERFLDLIHVKDTTSLTLKNAIMGSLSYHKLSVQDIRSQGYDGAHKLSVQDIRGQGYNGAIAATKDVTEVHNFFKTLNFIVNVISSSSKHTDQLQDAQIVEISHLIEVDEIEMLTDIATKGSTSSQKDIVNALVLVSTTKILLQKLRDEGWQSLLHQVVCFCKRNDILVPGMNETYRYVIRTRRDKDDITVEHHYRVELFIAAIDKHEINLLKLELRHYELDVRNHPQLKNSSTISELCRGLHETGKSSNYLLLDRLIRIIVMLHVSTLTSKRAFSAMKIVKTRLRITMNDDFLKSCLLINIEREIADTFSTYKIIDDFSSMKQRRAQLKVSKVNT